MIYGDQLEAIKDLAFDIELQIYKDDDFEIYLWRPSVLSKQFKGYDVKKNFQVWLRKGSRKFRPNHLRVMIDLDLRVRSRPDLQKELGKAFDGVFYGQDPIEAALSLKNESFEHFLNSIEITLCLSQLFIIEQDYAYRKESKYNPRTLFYQGWVRQIIDSGKEKEIDNLIMSVARGRPPDAKYTNQEDQNHSKHATKRPGLWWLSP